MFQLTQPNVATSGVLADFDVDIAPGISMKADSTTLNCRRRVLHTQRTDPIPQEPSRARHVLVFLCWRWGENLIGGRRKGLAITTEFALMPHARSMSLSPTAEAEA